MDDATQDDAAVEIPLEEALARDLLARLLYLKEFFGNDRTLARQWAIAATEAEKLLAWIVFVGLPRNKQQ